MNNVFLQFGLNPILLVAQVVNFLLLLFILKRYMYKPILKVLEDRKNKIAQSVKDAEEIRQRLDTLEQERSKTMEQASVEAKKIMDEATKTAQQIVDESREKASAETKLIIEKAKKSIELEREKMYLELRADLANMIAIGLKNITGKVLTEKDQKQLIAESLRNLQ